MTMRELFELANAHNMDIRVDRDDYLLVSRERSTAAWDLKVRAVLTKLTMVYVKNRLEIVTGDLARRNIDIIGQFVIVIKWNEVSENVPEGTLENWRVTEEITRQVKAWREHPRQSFAALTTLSALLEEWREDYMDTKISLAVAGNENRFEHAAREVHYNNWTWHDGVDLCKVISKELGYEFTLEEIEKVETLISELEDKEIEETK